MPIKKYNIKPNDVIFLSANTWDVSGGGNFGYDSIWVNRNKSQFDLLDYQPKKRFTTYCSYLISFKFILY